MDLEISVGTFVKLLTVKMQVIDRHVKYNLEQYLLSACALLSSIAADRILSRTVVLNRSSIIFMPSCIQALDIRPLFYTDADPVLRSPVNQMLLYTGISIPN